MEMDIFEEINPYATSINFRELMKEDRRSSIEALVALHYLFLIGRNSNEITFELNDERTLRISCSEHYSYRYGGFHTLSDALNHMQGDQYNFLITMGNYTEQETRKIKEQFPHWFVDHTYICTELYCIYLESANVKDLLRELRDIFFKTGMSLIAMQSWDKSHEIYKYIRELFRKNYKTYEDYLYK